ncbi:hypothetical protein Trco_007239 [Trichoderma cornu-damae]|uniref:Uncharacterized protein n=1 Tax=Trichoderma cornu-damae TaxID=654480 RepID=A0A9P8QJE7_9HYPO|nr:hypothetical protein Trco_007239 [Trichoderma cornu-damae]
MCVHFQSWNRCSSCFLTFNRRRNRVPCWNGSVSRWRIHRHGLSCRSGWYERADDEVYTHTPCEACSMEAANGADGKSNTAQTPNSAPLRGEGAGGLASATTRGTTTMKKVFLRIWPCKGASSYESASSTSSTALPPIPFPFSYQQAPIVMSQPRNTGPDQPCAPLISHMRLLSNFKTL